MDQLLNEMQEIELLSGPPAMHHVHQGNKDSLYVMLLWGYLWRSCGCNPARTSFFAVCIQVYQRNNGFVSEGYIKVEIDNDKDDSE